MLFKLLQMRIKTRGKKQRERARQVSPLRGYISSADKSFSSGLVKFINQRKEMKELLLMSRKHTDRDATLHNTECLIYSLLINIVAEHIQSQAEIYQ